MSEATQDPIITERLILRKLQPSDADAVFNMMLTPATMQYTTRAPLTELHQASTYLSERSGPSMFGVCLKPTSSTPETLIGLLGSVTFPEIGYRFSPSHAGKGYATEALLAFTPALFKMMPAEQKFAVARVDVENTLHAIGCVFVFFEYGIVEMGQVFHDGDGESASAEINAKGSCD
ncbi:acyl-CoA N-acyltransferase [Aureobasidium pullulans]|nr:acyl-CoA N-acyltransferase [Aureobasidium pullulans]